MLTCAERDSAKDQAVVWIFILATVGLLSYAAIRPWVEQWAEVCGYKLCSPARRKRQSLTDSRTARSTAANLHTRIRTGGTMIGAFQYSYSHVDIL